MNSYVHRMLLAPRILIHTIPKGPVLEYLAACPHASLYTHMHPCMPTCIPSYLQVSNYVHRMLLGPRIFFARLRALTRVSMYVSE